ncbi:MAG: enoyl-CoA hydratase/isomerase family protein [Acidobacteria bacterium]|nr:enoyl-CoA hydratase/isomerase family protein [Acidobacteriota bacterium]
MAEVAVQSILVERQGAVCSIMLNKPPLNIIDLAMIQEIRAALQQAEKDAGVHVLLFKGAGEKGFSAGVSVQDHTPDRVGELIPAFDDIFRLLVKTDKITVAAVQGFCLGGGLELAIACDLIVASEKAQFGQPEIKLGQLAPIGLILLPHLIGYRKAAELLLTGASIGAAEAQSLGLVNRVVAPDQLSQAVDTLLKEITVQSGAILKLAKSALRRTSTLNFEQALKETEDFFFESVMKTNDAKEGIFAFLEKRPPQWTHA